MIENKRFNLAFYDNYDGTFSIQDTLYLKENKHLHSLDEIVDLLNELHEENVELKNSLKEFDVFESDMIKGAVVTNDDFSVTLHSNNEAYMVCNMLNRFIRSVKNGSND